jgi:hypothetical protein
LEINVEKFIQDQMEDQPIAKVAEMEKELKKALSCLQDTYREAEFNFAKRPRDLQMNKEDERVIGQIDHVTLWKKVANMVGWDYTEKYVF